MKSWFMAVMLTLVSSTGSAADNSDLRSLMTIGDNRGWEAVGRLNFAGQSYCTGALIAPDLVLTAAHCLYDRVSGYRYKSNEIEFLAGWRNGRADARGQVSHVIAHPDFEFTSDDQTVRIANDLALLKLTQPIRAPSVKPFETDGMPRKGADVGVVSYGRGRADTPSIQEVCQVLARRSGTLVMSCDVEHGSSGAPVFIIGEDGVARIVSVIVAKAQVSGREVALGTNMQKPLQDLMALVAHSEAVESEPVVTVRVLRLSDTNGNSGAKFVRP
ncbi:MAG: trypsin-like serine protease [Paracoccaceae bacterium]